MRRSPLLSLLFLLSICIHVLSSGAAPPSRSWHLKLIRRRRHHIQNARFDLAREKFIGDRIKWRQSSCERGSSFAMPISSAAYAGAGQYLVRLKVGTPAQSFRLVADTGSDLTWMKCRYGACSSCADAHSRRPFLADQSSSFNPILCSSPLCKNSLPFSLSKCLSPSSPCEYDYSYADGSAAKGIFADEVATVSRSGGRAAQLTGVIVGCTSSSSGSSFNSADGVLGLGYSNTSFVARAVAAFGGKFSYCLVDHLSPRNASDYLVFGENSIHRRSAPDRRRSAELQLDEMDPFYGVRVRGISVGGEMLNISGKVWDFASGGGAIIDSGTSLTLLAEPAYRLVMERLSSSLAKYQRVKVDPFEFCFQWEESQKTFEAEALPRLAVHFARRGGGTSALEPPVKSYLIDVADGVKCIGILPASWPGVSTIGNILQQNHLWEFDIARKTVSFEPSSCSPQIRKL